MTVLWLKQLAAGLSPRKPGFEPKLVHVRFEVSMLMSHLQRNFPLTRRTKGRSLETFQKPMRFRKSGNIG